MQNNLKKLSTLMVGMVAVLVVVVAVFIPISSGLQDNIVSTENNSSVRYMVSENTSNLEISVNEDGTFKIGSATFSAGTQLLAVADNIMLSMAISGIITITDTVNEKIDNVQKVNFDRGTCTYTLNGTEYTTNYDTLLYPSERGTYGCSSGAFSANKNDTVYVISRGATSTTPRFVAEIVNGQNTGYLVDPCTNPDYIYTPYTGDLNFAINSTESADGLSIRYNSIETSSDATFGNFIFMPIHYSVLDGSAEAVRAIVNVLPLILIMGIVIAAGFVLLSIIGGKSEL